MCPIIDHISCALDCAHGFKQYYTHLYWCIRVCVGVYIVPHPSTSNSSDPSSLCLPVMRPHVRHDAIRSGHHVMPPLSRQIKHVPLKCWSHEPHLAVAQRTPCHFYRMLEVINLTWPCHNACALPSLSHVGWMTCDRHQPKTHQVPYTSTLLF